MNATTSTQTSPVANVNIDDTISTKELAKMIADMLLVRSGAVIDETTAAERARNIAAALSGLTIR